MAAMTAWRLQEGKNDEAPIGEYIVSLLCRLLPFLALPAVALATGFQPVDSIREAALSIVPDRQAEGVQVEVRVDPALRMPACADPLQAHLSGAGTAEVACKGAGWRLYVPVRVRRLAPVLVLARTISQGEVVPAEALRLERRDTSQLSGGSLSDPAQASGRVARRALMAGTVLSHQDVISPRLVRRGDNVTMVARYGAVEVRMAGRALGEAGVDERLSVENLGSRRIVQGILRNNGEVLVQ